MYIYNRNIIFSLCSAFLFLSSSLSTAAAEQMIAPGKLDLQVIDGSFIPEVCTTEILQGSSDILGCVAFDRKSSELWDRKYVDALVELGWTFTGGAANVYYMEKPLLEDQCNNKLYLFFWLLGDETETAKYGTSEEPNMDWSKIPFGVIYFILESNPVCGEDRDLK